MLEGKERQGGGSDPIRTPLRYRGGELRPEPPTREKTGPGDTISKKAGIRCPKASGPAATARPRASPATSPPLGGPAARARAPRRQAREREARPGPCGVHPRPRRADPGRSAGLPTDLAWAAGSAENRKPLCVITRRRLTARGVLATAASGGCRGVEWASRGRARPAGGRVPGPPRGFRTWPSVGVRTRAPTPAGRRAGLGPRPPGPPFPNAGGRRPQTSGALGGRVQPGPGDGERRGVLATWTSGTLTHTTLGGSACIPLP